MAHDLGWAIPIFRVRDVPKSLAYYTDVLGFARDWGDDGLVSVSRDRCSVFLTRWDQGQSGTWAWLSANEIDTLHDELRARGARIRHPPTNFPWAYEMQVEDLDGNVLRIGGEPKQGVPWGRFYDARGVLWDMSPAAP